MLRQLAVNNIVLVDRLELEFEPGLGVLTGETGAGKSILLDALGLALGLPDEARKNGAVLGANFPDTFWYRQSLRLLGKEQRETQPRTASRK